MTTTTTTRPLGEVTVPEVEQTATTLGVDPGELLAALHPAGVPGLDEVARTVHNVCTSYGDSDAYGWLVASRVRELLALPDDDQAGQCDYPGCPRTDTEPVPGYSREPVVSVPLCPEHAGPQHGEE